MNLGPCPTPDALQRLLDGASVGPDGDGARAHLADCVQCQALLDELSDDAVVRAWVVQTPRAFPEAVVEAPLERLVQHLCATSWNAPRTGAEEAEPPLSFLDPPRQAGDLGALGSYRVQEEVGRGGMGVVLRGYDEDLRRDVAIKVLRPDLADATTRQRLLAEARAAARFRHDHIVAVYAVAVTPAGLPYLVMEYLRGPTLAERLHARPPLPPAEAAAAVAQAADALAAAHAAGLIHRDVKPGNIILEAATGRAKLLDFGLARAAEHPGSRTLQGGLAGTPAYMSPEQARGDLHLDGRSDVYGLGATLYEALTGEAPFHGKPHLILQQVLNEEPRPLRQLNDAVPRDLETICLEAMAKEPSRRYPTAAALADDLRRWQRGEPVKARPVGRLQRLLRWSRRNPRVAFLSAALLVACLVGLAGVLWQWSHAERERSRAETERDTAVVQRAQARREFRRAREAVDRFLTDVSENPELKAHDLDPLRWRLLLNAREFYEQFVSDHPDDPELLADLGKAHGRLGTIAMELESAAKSVEPFKKKHAIFERLHEESPDEADYQHELADSHFQLGYALMIAGQVDEAERNARRARTLWDELARAHPSEPDYAFNAGRAVGDLGTLEYSIRHRYPVAEAYNRECLAAFERAIALRPAEAKYQSALAALLHRQGLLYGQTGRLEDAVAVLRRSIRIHEVLARAQPENAVHRARRGNDFTMLGELYLQLNRIDDAATAWRGALAALEQALALHPSNSLYQAACAGAREAVGRLVYWGKASPAEAAACLEQSYQVQEQLLLAQPRDGERWFRLTITYNHWFLFRVVFLRYNAALAAQTTLLGRLEAGVSARLKDHRIPETGPKKTFAKMKGELHRFALRGAAAVEEYEKAMALSQGDEKAALRQDRDLAAALALAQTGEAVRAAAAIEPLLPALTKNGTLQYHAAVVFAVAASAEKEQAARGRLVGRCVTVLRQALTNRALAPVSIKPFLVRCPAFDPIRSTPEFQRFLDEVLGRRDKRP